jgi:hypothetical protein
MLSLVSLAVSIFIGLVPMIINGVNLPTLMWAGLMIIFNLSGMKKIPVGWKAQLLFLWRRIPFTVGEGLQLIPFPFSLKAVDCRQKVLELDPLEIFTSDNVKVEIKGSLVWQVVDLHMRFGLDDASLKKGLDDIWDEAVRGKVRLITLQDLLGMQVILGHEAQVVLGNHSNKNWGLSVVRVIITSISPDKKITEDLEKKTDENLQREGEKVELTHFADRVMELMAAPPAGPGLSREQAIEQTQITMGKLTAKTVDTKNFGLDPATTSAIIAAFTARRKD